MTCEIKIDLTFTPTLDKVWTDFVMATPTAPHGWKLTNTHESEGDGFYFELEIPEQLSVSQVRDLRDWVSQVGGKIDEDTFADIVFCSIDGPPVTFASEEAFLRFANGCDYHCDLRGTIKNLEIEWSYEADEWVAAAEVDDDETGKIEIEWPEEDGEGVVAYDEEGGHQTECVCADCADATLSTDND